MSDRKCKHVVFPIENYLEILDSLAKGIATQNLLNSTELESQPLLTFIQEQQQWIKQPISSTTPRQAYTITAETAVIGTASTSGI